MNLFKGLLSKIYLDLFFYHVYLYAHGHDVMLASAIKQQIAFRLMGWMTLPAESR